MRLSKGKEGLPHKPKIADKMRCQPFGSNSQAEYGCLVETCGPIYAQLYRNTLFVISFYRKIDTISIVQLHKILAELS